MDLRKNWFYSFALIVFEIFIIYALVCGVLSLYDVFPSAIRLSFKILSLAATLCLAYIISSFVSRSLISRGIYETTARYRKTERGIVVIVLLIAAALRIWAIEGIAINPYSDFKSYYEIAELLSKGSLSESGYALYVASFPHVYGYPFVLSLLFRLTGPSVTAGLYLNMAAGVLSVFIIYKIAGLLGGRISGLAALLAAAFWPSHILYGAVLAAEPIFTLMLLFSFWLFILVARLPATTSNIDVSAFLCGVLGLSLALCSSLRPMALILLFAIIIYLLPYHKRFDENDKMLLGGISRLACQGWFRAFVILFSYVAVSSFISASISYNLGHKLPSMAASFGFNLMVGLNIGSGGTWNERDAEFFSEVLAQTNSATAAHSICIERALTRISGNTAGTLRLFMGKFCSLWSNDNYGVSWISFFLGIQGATPPSFVYGWLSSLNNFVYHVSLLFSAVYGFQTLKAKAPSPAFVLIMLFIGTVILHLVLETQNRYHYFIIPVFIILGSLAISNIFRGYCKKYIQKI